MESFVFITVCRIDPGKHDLLAAADRVEKVSIPERKPATGFLAMFKPEDNGDKKTFRYRTLRGDPTEQDAGLMAGIE